MCCISFISNAVFVKSLDPSCVFLLSLWVPTFRHGTACHMHPTTVLYDNKNINDRKSFNITRQHISDYKDFAHQ